MIRGVHVLALIAILLAALSVRASEMYTRRYQTLPVLDWIESRPPLADSATVPAASDLVRGLSRALPLLTIVDDARPRLPAFGPPAYFQRTMGGVRDASRIELGSPGGFKPNETPVHARLDVIVFNRAMRAAAWSDLMAREMDIRDPETGRSQLRTSGPDEVARTWVGAPGLGDGVATVAGHQAAVGYVLQVTYRRPDASAPAELIDLSARAEATARLAALDWSHWLAQQLAA